MVVDLQITFGGMCLLARDFHEEQLCVLLPVVRPDECHAHTATLHYYGRDDKLQNIDMPRDLDLRDLPCCEELSLDLPHRVVDLDYVVQEPISRDLVAGPLPDTIAARVLLRAGHCDGASRGARWRLGRRPARYISTTISWLIRGINLEKENSLGALSNLLGTGPNGAVSPLDRTFHIGIFNSEPDDKPTELPPRRGPGKPQPTPLDAHHFKAFYCLYNNPAEMEPPVFEDSEERRNARLGALVGIRGIKYSCIAATATVAEPSRKQREEPTAVSLPAVA